MTQAANIRPTVGLGSNRGGILDRRHRQILDLLKKWKSVRATLARAVEEQTQRVPKLKERLELKESAIWEGAHLRSKEYQANLRRRVSKMPESQAIAKIDHRCQSAWSCV